VALALGLSLCGGHAAQAGGALIETTAPLTDRSEESVKAAVIAAIDRAVRGASAMGFAWFQLRDAQVSEHEVAVQILATDEEPAKPEQPEPDSCGPGSGSEAHRARAPRPDLSAGRAGADYAPPSGGRAGTP
jgi:hypothetical protein